MRFVEVSLWVLAGFCAYAAVHHAIAALTPGLGHRFDRRHLWMALICASMPAFAFLQIDMLRAQSLPDYLHALRWNCSSPRRCSPCCPGSSPT
jgi:hypothetical protein